MGYTLQFEHQGKQFGVAAFYAQGEWHFSNGYVDVDKGETSDFTPAEGSFTPGMPPVLTITFDKSHFPHNDTTDNALRGFRAATADFKYYVPWGVVGQEAPLPPPVFGCDDATSDAVYTFTTGGHSGHAAPAPEEDAAAEDTTAPAANESSELTPAAAPEQNETPGLAAPLALLAALAVALARRRA